MPVLTITAEVRVGATINEAVIEAQQMANILGVNVRLKFNGLTLTNRPSGSAYETIRDYHVALDASAS